MSSLLTLRGIRKALADRVLFDIDCLELKAGQAYALTGINGAGKSTLLRVLAGLDTAEAAQVAWEGKPVRLAPYPGVMRRDVIYVHQHPIMFSTSVAHNVGYGLLARGESKVRVAAAVDEGMHWAGIEHLRASHPATLSGGEKQRVALARARILQPKLLLLDEPTSNLDGAAREHVIALIPALTARGGTVVMACHDRDLINLAGVQRWKLRDGRLEQK